MTTETQYPLVRLVAEPNQGSEVRFDFNDELAWAEHDGFVIGSPSMSGNPGDVGVEYGQRQIQFNLALFGYEIDALQRQTALARELLRPDNYLLFQLSPSAAPLWLKVFRSAPGAVSIENLANPINSSGTTPGSWWNISVSLFGEPFFVGEELTGSASILNNPYLGGLWSVIENVKGDAPAPVSFDFTAQTNEVRYVAPFLSIASLSTDWTTSGAWNYLAGVDTTYGAVGNTANGFAFTTNFVGSSTAFRTIVRAKFTPPFAGRYRLFVRMYLPLTTNTLNPTVIRVRGRGDALSEAVAPTTLGYGWNVVELGTYSFPKGNMPTTSGYTLGAGSNDDVHVEIARDGDYDPPITDYVHAVPVDLFESVYPTTTLNLDPLPAGLSAQQLPSVYGGLTVDSEAEAIVRRGASGALVAADPPRLAGTFPMLVPGATNVLTYMPREAADVVFSTAGVVRRGLDDVTWTKTLTYRYRPRYLYLGGY